MNDNTSGGGVCVTLRENTCGHTHSLVCLGFVQIVGRLASQVARLLVGKHKPTYLPHVDSGDYVVVTNARHVALSGRKYTDKTYTQRSPPNVACKGLFSRSIMMTPLTLDALHTYTHTVTSGILAILVASSLSLWHSSWRSTLREC